jgi:hypothetical protein
MKAKNVLLVIALVSRDRQIIDQNFDESSNLRDQNSSHNIKNGQTTAGGYNTSLTSHTPNSHISVFDMPEWFVSAFERRDFEMHKPSGDLTLQTTSPAKDGLLDIENISSFNEKNFPPSMGHWGYPPGNTPVRSIPKSVTKERYELYLDNFHHRWPIIHIPSFEKGDDPYVLTASVEMIGAWLHGSSESKIVALTLHDRLTNHIFQRMVCA